MGDNQPEAHVNGLSVLTCMALAASKSSRMESGIMVNDFSISYGLRTLTLTRQNGQRFIAPGTLIIAPLPPKDAAKLLEIFLLNDRLLRMVVTPVVDDALQTAITQCFTPVVAGGGLVVADDGAMLLIHRRGMWDLPKGHQEPGEPIEQTALREVEEETGLTDLTLGPKIGVTLHCYPTPRGWELKYTHWYTMHSPRQTDLLPQHDEGIEQAKWCTPQELQLLVASSFPTIQQVAEMALGSASPTRPT